MPVEHPFGKGRQPPPQNGVAFKAQAAQLRGHHPQDLLAATGRNIEGRGAGNGAQTGEDRGRCFPQALESHGGGRDHRPDILTGSIEQAEFFLKAVDRLQQGIAGHAIDPVRPVGVPEQIRDVGEQGLNESYIVRLPGAGADACFEIRDYRHLPPPPVVGPKGHIVRLRSEIARSASGSGSARVRSEPRPAHPPGQASHCRPMLR